MVEAELTVDRLRRICSSLPEVEERLSHGTPTFFVRGKRSFLTIWPDGHHDSDFPQLWCAAPDGAQGVRIAADPARYFRPPYVGHRGWLGVRLDQAVDDGELEELCDDAYRAVAPASLVERLDS